MTTTAKTKTASKKTAASKVATAAEPVAVATPEPIAETTPEAPQAVAAPTPAPIASLANQRYEFPGGVAQIVNLNGLVKTMNAGPLASSECRHLELATLLPHVAVELGASPEQVATMLAARNEKMLARPKIQRLLASKAAAV